MYHWDGHRLCGVSFQPTETKKLKGICPVCKKPLTIGVLNRVDQLADRPNNFIGHNTISFKKLVELDKIIAESLGIKNRNSRAVQEHYEAIIRAGKTELEILLDTSLEELKKITLPEITEGIRRMRSGEVKIKPGFDGQYGEVHIFMSEKKKNKQASLF